MIWGLYFYKEGTCFPLPNSLTHADLPNKDVPIFHPISEINPIIYLEDHENPEKITTKNQGIDLKGPDHGNKFALLYFIHIEVYTVDDETESWPVPSDLQDALDNVKYMHSASPSPIYKDDVFVEPLMVNSALHNALVEVHFNICHYKIGDHNSFTAIPLQITILKDGALTITSPYKCKNIRDGPVCLKPFRTSPPIQPASLPSAPGPPTPSTQPLSENENNKNSLPSEHSSGTISISTPLSSNPCPVTQTVPSTNKKTRARNATPSPSSSK